MRILRCLPILILIAIMLMSCQKDQGSGNGKSYDCVFVQNDDEMDGLIDDVERITMNQCKENSLSATSDIETNLVGEWELTGNGEGGTPSFSKPCEYMVVTKDELTLEFRNAFTDTSTIHLWDIDEVNASGEQSFRLNVEPAFIEGIFIDQFCQEYMYGDGTALDGNMYLFSKVQ